MSSTENPLFRFGIIADPQYAALAPDLAMDRYYANSLAKVSEAIAEFNKADLAFVVTLGDIIDGNWESFDAILPLYDKLRHERHFLLGNHDFAVAKDHLASVFDRVGMREPYYDFAVGGTRFVMLDGNEVSVFAPPENDPRRALADERLKALRARGAINANPWNASLGDVQFLWLRAVLKRAQAAGEPVIVMCHYPVYPENDHNMWDAERIVSLLAEHDNAVAYFCGHNHVGNYGLNGGCHFVNFKGMVDTETENTFAIVEVFADRLEIRGFGREESRTLAF
ncbi:phosphatase [Rhizobium sp. P32RR-XVIII]|uniref:metallophosphoesterase n=1 Tax=Rhizobium sp. P32RR-XVIII TaxID=2726738 RepID=UPI0014563436|nr:metallophosphoesterase [Rhizobium sp. P32RR-XVIII]NLS02772.1 phosphatase [Rhizobium sp. P32RR-XVIII]